MQLSGVVQDITERKLRELEREQLLLQLQDKAEQLAQVMRSVPEGVLLLDNLGCVLLANPRAEADAGAAGEYDAMSSGLCSWADMALEALLTSPPVGQWHTLQAGQQIYEVIASPVESGPVPAGWVLVLRDVTAERAVQEQLQRQERLAAVGQLAAGIAHDFNNIMSVISIYAEMTSEAPGLTDKRAGTHADDHRAGAAGDAHDPPDPRLQPPVGVRAAGAGPAAAAQGRGEAAAADAAGEHRDRAVTAAPGEYFVLADPTRMQQLVMNLAVNARDAMPEGGQLRIALAKLTVTDAKHRRCRAWARATGCASTCRTRAPASPPEHLAHIFEPFFTTKEPGKGTGLGLAQVHGIVAQHDGHITVTSEPGGGTTFTIYLPALVLAGGAARHRRRRGLSCRGAGRARAAGGGRCRRCALAG